MAEFTVRIVRISQPAEKHPKADRLYIVRVGGFVCLDRKEPDGTYRLNEGDYVAYIPEASILPDGLMFAMGLWKAAVPATDGKPAVPAHGMLDGTGNNRLKARQMRSVFSQGLVFPVEKSAADGTLTLRVPIVIGEGDNMECVGFSGYTVHEGQDVKELLGIVKWEPPVPEGMEGEACSVFGAPAKFDVENIQTFPELFEPGMPVRATEKGHGTLIQLGLVPGFGHSDLFCNGDVYVTSKQLGNKGIALKDSPENSDNLYVTILREELARGLEERLRSVSNNAGGEPVRVFGEVMGRGVQDLHYGFSTPVMRVFDIMVGDISPTPAATDALALQLGLKVMPTLYTGPYDEAELIKHRDGRDTFSNSHIREGIVVRAEDGSRHPHYGRRMAKMISPAYLLREGGTEFN